MRTDILEKEEQIRQWIIEGKTKGYISQELHCKSTTLNSYLKKIGIEYGGKPGIHPEDYKTNYKTALEYINSNSVIKSPLLKEKLIRDGLKKRQCEICGVSIWQNVQLPLELHHKDGNHYNNALENLQILCPNCHSIQEGNSGANIGKYSENATVQELVDYPLLEGGANGVGVRIPAVAPRKKKCKCKICGSLISYGTETSLCQNCYSKQARKVEWPEREVLKKKIREQSFLSISREYDVTDNAIRKWCKKYNFPSTKTEIKLISDEEWKDV